MQTLIDIVFGGLGLTFYRLVPISQPFGHQGPNLSSGCRKLNLTDQKQYLSMTIMT